MPADARPGSRHRPRRSSLPARCTRRWPAGSAPAWVWYTVPAIEPLDLKLIGAGHRPVPLHKRTYVRALTLCVEVCPQHTPSSLSVLNALTLCFHEPTIIIRACFKISTRLKIHSHVHILLCMQLYGVFGLGNQASSRCVDEP